VTLQLSAFVRLIRRGRRLLGAALAAALTLVLVPLGQPAHAITTISAGTAPFGPQAILPQWYGDATGLRLQPCQLAVAPCLVIPGLPGGPANFVPPNGEVFYWVAQANLNTAGHGGVGTTPSLLMMGVEGAWVPAPGPDVFNRLRFRVGVPNPGTYTVTYPYGAKTFNVAALGAAGRDINDTTDSGAFATAAAPANFALASGPCPAGGCTNLGTGGPFEPYLTWDGAVAPAPPAGFISDGVTPHPLVGSPTGTNFFRVEGPGINPNPADPATACTAPAVAGANCIQTKLFVLNGQLAPGLSVAPGSLAFPATAVAATTAAQTVTVTNSNATPITVGAATITGANAAEYAIATNTCTGVAVAANGTCTIGVTFKPTAAAATHTASVSILGDPAGPLNVALSGVTQSPVVSLSATSVAFPDTQTGTTSAPQTVTVTNTGNAPLHVSSVVPGGTNVGDFAQTNTCVGAPVAPAGTCTASATFTPASAAGRSATLTLTDDASPSLAASTQTVTLTGAGIAPPAPAQVPAPLPAPAPAPAPAPGVNPISPRPLTAKGYWLAASDGGVFNFGDAAFFGSTGAIKLNKPIVTMASTPTRKGYWLVASDGGVFNFGDAAFFGSTGAFPLNRPIVAMTPTPSGNGYWLIASDGGVFSFGDAAFQGSTGAITLNKPIVAMAATPTGKGYWLIASDGGVFNFGDAGFHGSTGAFPLNKPIVAMAATPSGKGYWLIASDGGVFNFGDASYQGSTGAIALNRPIVTMAATPTGNGYWLVASDGGVFNFGDAGFHGSTGAFPLNKPIVTMAA
jgi:hypothetical protein